MYRSNRGPDCGNDGARFYKSNAYGRQRTDYGPEPFAVNIEQAAKQNKTFRTALWTGTQLQLTLMCIPAGGRGSSKWAAARNVWIFKDRSATATPF